MPSKPEPAATTEVTELDKRIAKAQADLKAEEATGAAIGATLMGLKASLDSLAQNMGRMSDERQNQAAALRKMQMQMQMLDKAEAYERERRNQSAELVKIKVLLADKRTEEETIQLTIRSLALSITALKQVQQILEEIAFFFKSFADFMGQVAGDAAAQVKHSRRPRRVTSCAPTGWPASSRRRTPSSSGRRLNGTLRRSSRTGSTRASPRAGRN